MKRILYSLTVLVVASVIIAATISPEDDPKRNFVEGDPGIASINSLSFGPEGILFIRRF